MLCRFLWYIICWYLLCGSQDKHRWVCMRKHRSGHEGASNSRFLRRLAVVSVRFTGRVYKRMSVNVMYAILILLWSGLNVWVNKREKHQLCLPRVFLARLYHHLRSSALLPPVLTIPSLPPHHHIIGADSRTGPRSSKKRRRDQPVWKSHSSIRNQKK